MFKIIENFPNYAISEDGIVINQSTDRILTPTTYGPGYLRVNLSKDGKQYPLLIHRLVATTFIPNPDNLPVVHHIDGDPSNNCVANLKRCTTKENSQQKLCKPKGPKKQIPPRIVKPLIGQFSKEGELIATYPTITAAANVVHPGGYGGICNCLHHKPHYNTAYGYICEFIEQ